MNTNILVTASALSDQDLHLAALDTRKMLYAAQGYGSLFSYCTQALRLSEDAACNRIEAARSCRRFPVILELLASGSLTLTSIRLLGRHLTAENHESVLAKARDRRRHEIEALVAKLAPRPDVPSAVRKLPYQKASPLPLAVPGLAMTSVPSAAGSPIATGTPIAPSPSTPPATPRPIVQAWAPERYRVQFTIGPEAHEKLRRVQALLRREIPDGDPGAIFDRALTVLLEKVEKTKLGAVAEPRPDRLIRSATDKEGRKPTVPSRHVPREVKRVVWGATLANAPSCLPPDGDERSLCSLSSTMCSPFGARGRPLT